MTAQELLNFLYINNVSIDVDGEDLLIDAPEDFLDERLIELLGEHKLSILNMLRRFNKTTYTPDLSKHDFIAPYSCATTLAQDRILFLEEIAGNNSYYNIPFAYKISGAIDTPALKKSFILLIKNHEILRTTYIKSDIDYIQLVNREKDIDIDETDISYFDNKETKALELLEKDANHKFLLETEWPIKVRIIKLSITESIISINVHHIAADGLSAKKLINDINQAYNWFINPSTEENFPNLGSNYQYSDYAIWQKKWLESQDYIESKNYWINTLKGAPHLHSIPTDFLRPSNQSITGDFYSNELPLSLGTGLVVAAQHNKTTPFVIFQAAFAALLSRYSSEKDILFGIASANRYPTAFINNIGLFVNTLALRYQLSNDLTFSALLAQAVEINNDALKHQSFPFDALVDHIQPQRDLSYNALIQIMLVMHDNAPDNLHLQGADIAPITQKQKVSKFDFSLHITPKDERFILEWEYNTALFEHKTIEMFSTHFIRLLDALISIPNSEIYRLPLVDKDDIPKTINRSLFPPEKCVHQLIEDKILSSPDAIAIIQGDRQFTYRELNDSANKIAANLLENNPNIKRVGVCLHKSAEMIFTFFAILKMGAVYVPLDPYYPKERLEFMIKDSAVDVLITDESFSFEFNIPISILRTGDMLRNTAANFLPVACNLESPAYIIYTSGSTGKPKGVLVSHKSLFYSLIANQSLMQIDNRDSMPTIGSQAFGVSLLEILLPLISGGTVLILQKADILNIDLLTHLTDKVTVLHAVPSLMRIWLDLLIEKGGSHSYPNLRLLLVGGEAVPDKLLKDIKSWRPHVRLLELYGMTELAVVCSSYDMKEGSAINYCIGKPHPNTEFYVLNEQYQHQPIGIPGELHIGGLSLATEYINQPEITSEKFIVNPFDATQRLYKSGDRVKRLANGHYEFLGRVDFQVSVRGVRIECGEIETLALQVEGVKQAIAHVFDIQENDQILILYFTLISEDLDQTIIADNIRAHLNQYLPDYMCPSIIQKIDTFPLNPNGKVDRKALPEPNFSAQQHSYIAPRTKIEERMCEIWQEALSSERVGITDNFFKLGGHSLSATRLVARINQVFKITLPLKTFFTSPTVEALVEEISALENNSIYIALAKTSREKVLLPSFAQQRLWILDQIDGGSAHYNLPGGLTLSGHLNYSALTAAFNSIIERHESLRTCFAVGDDGQPIQIIQAARPFLITMTDLSALEEGACHLQKTERILAEAHHVFDLSTDVMLRAELLKIAEDEHFLLVVMHHIASDGWSLSIFLNELCALYSAYSRGDTNPLPPLSIQYADYAHWQRSWLQGEVLEQQLSYWAKQLSNLPVVHSLPLDRIRPNQQSFEGDVYKSHITNTTRSALNQLCQSQGATLFMGLHATFSVLLSRYSNETDIVVGSPIANREHAGIAELIGFFVNTLVLRSDLSENPSFSTLLNQSKAMLLDAYAHQQVPFEKIVERLQPERNLSHSPLFQVMLVLQNNEEGALDIPGLILAAAEQHVGIAKYDLTLYVNESLDGLKLNWEYNTDLFESKTIARMANHFELLLEALIAKPNESVFKVEMLSAQERQQLLVDWNNTRTDYPNDKCIHELFEAQVEKNPDAIAVVFEKQQLTYGELNTKANQLAHYLINEKQVKPDALVGICVERSLEMVISILAILKAGGAYVPLDPEYPDTRLKYMLDNANLTTVLTQRHLRETTPVSDAQAVYLDDENLQQQLQTQSTENPNTSALGLTSNHLAYVIYTSGSTGNPKGVMVEHTNVVNFLTGMRDKPGFNTEDCLLAVTSTSFDIHGLELFLPLVGGAKLIVAAKEVTINPDALSELIKQHCVSVMQATPATWKMLLDANWQLESPLKVLCGGEALGLHLATELLNKAQVGLWNMYGPTETTIWSTTQQILPKSDQIFMGQPIANTQIYIATKSLELAPVGVAGELLIGGAGVTRGYLHRPELTAEKFIPNPFYDKTNPASSERLYKTGDLVRWLPDGNLEFLGRIDHQVKIRGFRIELGEIENTLMQHPRIKDSVVVAKETQTGDKQLVAYVVPTSAEEQNDNSENKDYSKSKTDISFSLFYFGADNDTQDNKYDLYLKAAKFADDEGFEAIWTPERHFDPVGGLYPNPAILSAAIATQTTRVKLRSGSVVLPLHDPIRVAEEWSVVDNLSNGRVGLAIASGWHTRDFVLAPHNFASRKDAVINGIKDLKRLWSGDSISRKDGNGRDVEVKVYPQPVQTKLPLWITAAGNPETFIEAGRIGAHLLTHLLGQTIEELEEKLVLYRESLSKHGHNPKHYRVTLMIHTYLGEDLAKTLEQARVPFMTYMRAHISLLLPLLKSLDISTEGYSETDLDRVVEFAFERYTRTASLIGTPQSTLPIINRLKEAGVDEVACLIDWMDSTSALQGFESLGQLQKLAQSAAPSKRALTKYCRDVLPHYMVPSAFVLLESLPLTPNGKVDRKALPEPDISILQATYIAPRTQIEQALCNMWHEILKINPIGITDNFFQLGGNSLLAARLVRKINLEIDDRFKISHIFQYPRIEESARFIEQNILTTPEIIAEAFDASIEYSIPVNRLFNKNKTLNVIAHHTGSIFLDIQSTAITFELLQSAFSLLREMHPILNSRQYINSAGNLVHTFRHTKEIFNVIYKDFSIPNELDICEDAWLNCDEYVATIPSNAFSFTEDDELFKAYLFNCGEHNPKRLFIIWHHNILDGFSIEIVMNDFDEILSSLLKGESYNTRKHYTNIIEWYDVISSNAKNYWAQDLQYWKSKPWDHVLSLPHDKVSDDFLDDTDWANEAELASIQCLWQKEIITAPLRKCLEKTMSANSLSTEKTSVLYSSKISQQGINAFDVILLAIARVFSAWTKNNITLLEIINSGRGPIFSDFDNTSTIGDIAYNAPLLINSRFDLPVLSSLRHISSEREALPKLALSYKWNKNILEKPEYKTFPQSQILINYDTGNRYDLGTNFNLTNNQLMTPSYINSNYKDISPDLISKDRVYIMVDIKDGKLIIRIEIPGYDGGVIYKNPYYHPSRSFTLSRDIIIQIENILHELLD